MGAHADIDATPAAYRSSRRPDPHPPDQPSTNHPEPKDIT